MSNFNNKINKFITYMERIGFVYIEGFKNNTTKCIVKCPNGHYLKITPSHIYQGQRCTICNKYKNKQKSFNNFIKYIEENTNDYRYIEGFTSTQNKCVMKHLKCGRTWKVKPNNFICSHSRCPYCVDKRNRAYIKESDWLDYVNKNLPEHKYLGGFTKMKEKCLMQHSCGYSWDVVPASLKQGLSHCPKCAALSNSFGETFIKNFLISKNISYDYPKSFDNLYDITPSHPLRYDFCIPKKRILIEYQGRQHYKLSQFSNESFDEKLDNLAIQNLHDDMKRQYAKDNNWVEIEVPFTCNTQQKVNDFLTKRLEVM